MPEQIDNKSDRDLRRSLHGAAFRSIQPLIINAIGVPAMAYIIRRLGATGYGEWSVATSLVATTAVLASLGLRGPFVRRVARDPACASDALAAQLGARMFLAILTSAATVAIAIALGYSATVVTCTAVAAFGMMLGTIGTTGSDLLEAFQRLPATAVASFISGIVLTAASVVAVWLWPNPVIVALVYLIGPLTMIVIFAGVIARSGIRVRIDLSATRGIRLLWAGRHFAVQQLVFTVSTNLALLMLPKVIGTVAFGLFCAGTLLVTRLAVFPDAIATAFYPLVSKSTGSDRRRRVWVGVVLSVAWCSVVAVAVYVMAGWIARVLFPRTPAECQHVIEVTIWALPLMGLELMTVMTLNAAGREAVQARLSLVASACSLFVGAMLIVTQGMAGACWYMIAHPAIVTVFLAPQFLRSVAGGENVAARDEMDPTAVSSAPIETNPIGGPV